MFKSYCCIDTQTCEGSSSSQISYYQNPHYPEVEVEPVITCSSRIAVEPGTCLVRLVLLDFVLSVSGRNCLTNLFTVIGAGTQPTQVYCGDSKGREGRATLHIIIKLSCVMLVLVPVHGGSSISLSFLVSRPGAKWSIMATQEKCAHEGEQEVVDENTEAIFEEVTTQAITTGPDIQGMTCNANLQSYKTSYNHNWPSSIKQ